MKKYLAIFISSVLAGFCITFGATVYLLCLASGQGTEISSLMKVIGAFMFCIGLFTIIHFSFWLYTGKVGYVLDNKPIYLVSLVVCFLGNACGSLIMSSLISLTSQGKTLCEVATPIVEAKLNSTPASIFIMSCLCGVMIYLAVEGHKKCPYTIGKVIFAFMPIILFILCGFEHVVANVTYFRYAAIFSWKAFGYFVLMFLGNAVGSIVFDALIKAVKYLEKESEDKEASK